MGVDFITCTNCGHNFPDCGPFEQCDEDLGGCGARYCSEECAEIERVSDDEMTCVDCRDELASDENLLAYLLGRLGKTREQLEHEFNNKVQGPIFPELKT